MYFLKHCKIPCRTFEYFDRFSKLEFFWDPHHKLIKIADLFPIAFSLFFSCCLVYLMNFHPWFTLQPYTLNKISMSLLIIRSWVGPYLWGPWGTFIRDTSILLVRDYYEPSFQPSRFSSVFNLIEYFYCYNLFFPWVWTWFYRYIRVPYITISSSILRRVWRFRFCCIHP